MLILTHNYPSDAKDNSGIWIKRLWGDKPVMKIGLGLGLIRSLMQLRSGKGLIIAYWTFPAGVLAWLSGRPYILNCVGLDVFIMQRHRWVAWLMKPVLNKAVKLVFIGGHPMRIVKAMYDGKYDDKMQLIYLPVPLEEFHR